MRTGGHAALRSKMPVVSALVLALASRAWGQTPPPSAANSSAANHSAANHSAANQPIIAASEELSIDLVVRDKKGKPVLDLRPADLKVEDGGAPVKLSDLRLLTPSGNDDRKIILVFDRLESMAGVEARTVAAQLLKVTPSAGISMAVLKVDGRLRLIQPLTSDHAQLKTAIRSATTPVKRGAADASIEVEKRLIAMAKTGPGSAGSRASASKRQQAQVLLTALTDSQRIVHDQHTRPSLSALLALSRAEGKWPGRKAVVFFTQGLRLDSNFRELLHSIVGAANRAGVSIYAVDANSLDSKTSGAMVASLVLARAASVGQGGVAPPVVSGPITDGTPGGLTTMAGEQAGRLHSGTGDPDQNPLADLCAGTGGVYISNAENLRFTLRRMVDDLSTYYEASYGSPISQYDGSFRSVKVRAVRRGLKIQARSGYFALPPGNDAGLRPFEAPLLKVLTNTQLPDGVDFRAAILHVGEMPDGNTHYLVIEAPLKDIQFQEDSNTRLFSFHLSMVARIKDATGTIVESFSDDLARHGALEARDGVREDTVTMQRHFTAEPGEYALEVVVQDRMSGKIGAQRTNFTVGKTGSGATLSDIALVRRGERIKADADPSEPFQFHEDRIVPDISKRLSPESKDIAFFFLIFPDPHAATPKLEMEIRRDDGQVLGRAPLALRAAAEGKPLAYEAGVHAGSFAPGQYTAAAILTQGGVTVERAAAFSVEGTQLASVARASTVATDLPASHGHSPLSIVPLTGAAAEPSAEVLDGLLAGAKLRAIEYMSALPNFTCVEMTDRAIDPSGAGNWRHKDTLTELVRFRDQFEHRVTLKLNNAPSEVERASLNGVLTHGEFGGMLNAVFNPEAQAEFKWKETDALGGDQVQVFAFHVTLAHSTFALTADNGQRMKTAFHGLVYVDELTRAVRRITMQADGLPEDFPTRSASFSVDYDYVAIGDHDYLMPSAGSARVESGKHMAVLNEFEFRDYKKYGAESTIKFDQ